MIRNKDLIAHYKKDMNTIVFNESEITIEKENAAKTQTIKKEDLLISKKNLKDRIYIGRKFFLYKRVFCVMGRSRGK